MEELIKLVSKKAGINETVAQIAVSTVISNLKSKLPSSVSGILDSFLGSGSTTATKSKTTTTKSTKTTKGKNTKSNDMLGDVGNIIGGLGKILGKK